MNVADPDDGLGPTGKRSVNLGVCRDQRRAEAFRYGKEDAIVEAARQPFGDFIAVPYYRSGSLRIVAQHRQAQAQKDVNRLSCLFLVQPFAPCCLQDCAGEFVVDDEGRDQRDGAIGEGFEQGCGFANKFLVVEKQLRDD
jgi:hypothetical protein